MSDDANREPASRRLQRTTSVGLWIGLLLLVGLTLYFQQPGAPPGNAPPDQPAADADRSPAADEESPGDGESRQGESRHDGQSRSEGPVWADSTRIEDVTVRGLDGRVEFRGTVDLAPTVARIERGDRLRFAHDGSTFGNRERRLPHKPGGYYHEYVHPTPGISGPGPQRVIVGRDGEIYYTFDHYQTFRRIK